MNFSQWVIASAVAGIIVLLFLFSRFATRKSMVMSKYAMTILLDEFLYQQQKNQFLKLIESTKVENSGILFQSAMFNLEDAAEKVAATKLIGIRMWQINQKALKTGQSAAKILESTPTDSDATYPRFEQNIAISHFAVKARLTLKRFRRRVNQLFGL